MEVIDRRDYRPGWQPGVDAVSGPPNVLLRADNLVLDEEGVVATRLGTSRLTATAFETGPVHTLFTTQLNNQRLRFAGSGDDFWCDLASGGLGQFARREQGMPGSGRIAVGTFGSQVFYARGSRKRKYDGLETGGDNGRGCRNWGIAKPSGTADLSMLEPSFSWFSSFSGGDGWNASDGVMTLEMGEDGDDEGSIAFSPDGALSATVTKDYGLEVDFSRLDDGREITDEDSISISLGMDEPDQIEYITVLIDCNGDSPNRFADYFYWDFYPDVQEESRLPTGSLIRPGGASGTEVSGYQRSVFEEKRVIDDPVDRIRLRPGRTINDENAHWFKVKFKRGQMRRVGNTPDKGWATIRALRVVAKWKDTLDPETVTLGAVSVDNWFVEGGVGRTLTGEYTCRFQYIFNSGRYQAKSPLSDASDTIKVANAGIRARIPAPSDPQVNEIWVHLMGGSLDRYYRFGLTDQVTGNINVDLELSDRDAIEQNNYAEVNLTGPPNGIKFIIAPHYGRLLAITQGGIYPSLQGDPEGFNPGHAMTPFDDTEVIWWAAKIGTGVAIGTNKDIYALDGTGSELPDGTLGFILRPLNVGRAPIAPYFAQDGDELIYLAADGFRKFNGGSSAPLRGSTDLLYRGYVRHNVSPANLGSDPGIFSCDISSGMFYTLYSSDGNPYTSAVHRLNPGPGGRWDSFIYPFQATVVYREPDGKIMIGTYDGHIYQVELGNADYSPDLGEPLDINWEAWTVFDGGNDPRVKKEMFDFRLFVEGTPSGLYPYIPITVALHLDGDPTPHVTLPVAQVDGVADLVWQAPLTTDFRQVQARISGSGNVRIRGVGFSYRPRPLPMVFWDSGFVDTGYNDVTFMRELDIKIRSPRDVEVKVYYDDTLYSTYDIPIEAGIARPYTVPLPRTIFGHQPRVVVSMKTNTGPSQPGESFELYWARFRFRQTGKATSKSVLMIQPTGAHGYAKTGNA